MVDQIMVPSRNHDDRLSNATMPLNLNRGTSQFATTVSSSTAGSGIGGNIRGALAKAVVNSNVARDNIEMNKDSFRR